MHVEKKNWYAVYTKPRWEKKVLQLFLQTGIDAYCPLNKVRRKWSDRIKWVEEPLFKSYVFVCIKEGEQQRVRMTNGVVNFVYWIGKPAVIKDQEIEVIRKFLSDYTDVEAVPLDLKQNTKIMIRQGALMNKEATVIKILKNKVQVSLESIGYSLVAVIDKSNVSII